MEYALKLEHVSKHYPAFSLEDIDLALPQGSILGLVGVNGAGKSTTMRCARGLSRPDSGTVTVLGRPLAQADFSLVGTVFDECSFPLTLTAAQVERVLSGIYKSWDRPLFFQLLDRFSVASRQPIKELSRGTKMKLSLAAALAHHPKLLILDEPTSGLDPVVRGELMDLFLELIADEETSILLSSHITSDLERVADSIIFLHQGRVRLSAPKDDLLYDYAIAKGSAQQLSLLPPELVVSRLDNAYSSQALVRQPQALSARFPDLVLDRPSLDDYLTFFSASRR